MYYSADFRENSFAFFAYSSIILSPFEVMQSWLKSGSLKKMPKR